MCFSPLNLTAVALNAFHNVQIQTCYFSATNQKSEEYYSVAVRHHLMRIQHMNSIMEYVFLCLMSLVLKGKKKSSAQYFSKRPPLNLSKTTLQLLGSCNCPQFSSHRSRISTRLVVFGVCLGDWAEATAACLFTFPLTAWSHSRPVVFCCMDSDCYSACCERINASPASD